MADEGWLADMVDGIVSATNLVADDTALALMALVVLGALIKGWMIYKSRSA